jgi:hypothetical protein
MNRSESMRRAACPSMMSAQPPDFTSSCQASAEHLSNALNFRPYASKTAFRATHQPKAGRQGNHYPVTVGEMRRTPRGGQWYAKSVSNLLARA